jgi:hypothetical protein
MAEAARKLRGSCEEADAVWQIDEKAVPGVERVPFLTMAADDMGKFCVTVTVGVGNTPKSYALKCKYLLSSPCVPLHPLSPPSRWE